MRIGFDAVRGLRNSRGLGNYARRVLAGLHQADPALEVTLYSYAPPRRAYADLPARLGATLRLPPPLWKAPGARALWRTFRLGRAAARDGVALYHGLTHEIPRDLPHTGIPGVVSFLDLLWRRVPQLFSRADRLSYDWRYRWSAEHATAIIAASRQTREDLLEWYGVDAARVVVIPPPCDDRFAAPVSPSQRERVRARHGIPGEFLLSVATLERRKNHHVAIAALALLDPDRTPPLLLVGADGGERPALLALAERLGVAGRVMIRSGLGDSDLAAVMQSATLFLFPSLFEGFGLPIVEALSAGIPVVASRGAGLEDAGGGESRYVPATDPQAWAEEIRRVLDDAALADRMQAEGRIHAARFGGRALAERLLHLYRAVLAGDPLPGLEELTPTSATESPLCAG